MIPIVDAGISITMDMRTDRYVETFMNELTFAD